MMDPHIGWLQTEQRGPALDLWMKLWKDFQQTSRVTPSKTNGTSSKKDDTKAVKMTTNPFARSKSNDDNPSITIDLDNNLHLISKYKGIPWRTTDDKFDSGIEGLHQEIEKFFHYMKPRPEEYRIRKHVLWRLTKTIESLWPDSVVECFGSTMTGTYLPTSDIDIVVINYRWTNLSLRLIELEQHMLNLHQCLPNEISRLDRAAVPIIKMVDAVSRIRINISFNMPQVVKCVKLVNSYKDQFPHLIKLLYVIKYFVLQRDLNEVFKGGLSSYALVLMIVHFFKANPELLSGPQKPNLGALLIQFFELYGRHLNYDSVGLRVRDGVFVNKKEILEKATNGKNSRYPPSLLCIQDPLDETNNVSRSSYAIPTIKDAFGYAYDMLQRAVGPNQAVVDKSESILGRIIRITDEVVDRRDEHRIQWTRMLPQKMSNNWNGYHNNGHKWNHLNNWNHRSNEGFNVHPKNNWLQRHHQGHRNPSNARNTGQRGQMPRRMNSRNEGLPKGFHQNRYPQDYKPNNFRSFSFYSFDNHDNYQRKRALQVVNDEEQTQVREKSETNKKPSNSKEDETRTRANTLS